VRPADGVARRNVSDVPAAEAGIAAAIWLILSASLARHRGGAEQTPERHHAMTILTSRGAGCIESIPALACRAGAMAGS
jgi:hypothetical protein